VYCAVYRGTVRVLNIIESYFVKFKVQRSSVFIIYSTEFHSVCSVENMERHYI